MSIENTHKRYCVTMAEYAHDLIAILNKMSTPRPYDVVNSYPIMYESANTLIYYTDAVRTIINSPKTPFISPCKKELNAFLEMLERDIQFIYERSQDYLFDIREYGVDRKQSIKKQINRIKIHLSIFRFFDFLGLVFKQLTHCFILLILWNNNYNMF